MEQENKGKKCERKELGPRTGNASVIYREASKKRLVRGRSVNVMAAASVYFSCRQCGIPRTAKEISEVSGANKKLMARGYRKLVNELDYSMPTEDYMKYVNKFSSSLCMDEKIGGTACKIIEAAKKSRTISGKGRDGAAAAACYISSILNGERKCQREISEIARVTEVTIRNNYKKLVKDLQFDVYL
jgi:transcription initiation factor TFIIB